LFFGIFFHPERKVVKQWSPGFLEGGSWNSGIMGIEYEERYVFFFGYPEPDPWISSKIAGGSRETCLKPWKSDDFVSPIEKKWGLKHRFIWVDRRCWICWMWEHFMYPPGNMASLAIGIPPFRHREFPSLPCVMTAGWFGWRTDTSSLLT
jgi:hypothetical protein